MGIFGKLFNKQKETNTPITEKPDHWDFYMLRVDDLISSIYLNLSQAERGKINSQQTLFWFSLKMNNPREDGLSSQEEFDILLKFEESLNNYIANNSDGIYVGRLTTDGRRDFYVYVSNSDKLVSNISQLMQDFSEYQYALKSINDPDWEQYFNFLYPNPHELQKIMNRGVVAQLEKNGDSLTKPRMVFHWIYFRTAESMNEYIKQIIDWGYKVDNTANDKSLGEYPFVLSISRTDSVDYHNIDAHILPLWELAKKNNANYDGWETSVEKN